QRGGGVTVGGPAVGGEEQRVVEVTEESIREVDGRERGALTAPAGLRTERRVGAEQRAAVVGLPEHLEVLVAEEIAREVPGLERHARVVGEAAANDPRPVVLVDLRAGRRDRRGDRVAVLMTDVARPP